jgi:hypothetical protein
LFEKSRRNSYFAHLFVASQEYDQQLQQRQQELSMNYEYSAELLGNAWTATTTGLEQGAF